jgi:trimeric autotransporter adhesin
MLIISFIFRLFAQSPILISYQAIIRDINGTPLANVDKSIECKILRDSPTGAQVYSETHSAHTNSFELVNLQIGSITPGLETINWANGPYFLKVEVDAVVMGTTQLISVPYALYSKSAENGFQGTSPYFINDRNVGFGTNDPKSTLSVRRTTPNDSAIFEVKNNNGLTVFAVYNKGVRISIDERTKATKGGFAIGGYTTTKGTTDYLRISHDSIRMYIDNSTVSKGTKGGFAIGGFGNAKTPGDRYMLLSGNEGLNSGYNTYLGYNSGNPSKGGGGTHNIAIGYYARATTTTGYSNIFIGDSVGLINGNGFENIFIGRNSGAKMYTGYNNVYIG